MISKIIINHSILGYYIIKIFLLKVFKGYQIEDDEEDHAGQLLLDMVHRACFRE